MCVCDPLNVTKLAKDIDIVNLLGSSSGQFGSSEASHIVVWSSAMSVMGREARDLVRTEFLDTDRQWTVEDIQERLRDENLEDDFEYVLCDIARYGDDGILVEAEKASTILFLKYDWSIDDIVMYLQDAPVNHLAPRWRFLVRRVLTKWRRLVRRGRWLRFWLHWLERILLHERPQLHFIVPVLARFLA